mmetsp:Transcript_95235/g.269043  ORF Transcript_95235/g.269043 Transcript_95235/m.269043 type:complete len:351 (+) Transcript_95235:74-1126(+)
MYGRVSFTQTAEQARSQPYGRQETVSVKDPQQQVALETLLRTIAERAAHMETKDILTLTQVFTAACEGGSSTTAATAPASFAEPSETTASAGMTFEEAMLDPSGDILGLLSLTAEQQLMQQATMPAHPLPSLPEIIGSHKTVKVSARTNVKSVAGAISNILRQSETLVATAVGPEGVNHVMKALSITRCYIAAEGIDLTVTVTEVEPEAGINTGRCYAFTVVRMHAQPKSGPLCAPGVGRTDPHVRFVRPPEQQTELRVAGNGQTGPVAGAIAKLLREDREVIITAVGPASVAKSVEAMAMARTYIQTNVLELWFYPGFETIIFQGNGPGAGEQRSSVKIHTWPETAATG